MLLSLTKAVTFISFCNISYIFTDISELLICLNAISLINLKMEILQGDNSIYIVFLNKHNYFPYITDILNIHNYFFSVMLVQRSKYQNLNIYNTFDIQLCALVDSIKLPCGKQRPCLKDQSLITVICFIIVQYY